MSEEQSFPGLRFPIAMLAVAGVLAATLTVQTVFLIDSGEFLAETAAEETDLSPEDADVHVAVGDGYFIQDDSDLPDDVVEAEVGDVIYFYNEGDIRHTATVPEFGFDRELDPGEEAFLEVDEPAEETVLDCTLHAHHEAVLTVRE